VADQFTYYAIVDDYSSRDRPAGVLRRVRHEGGQHDEAFTRDLIWKRTDSLYSAEHGDTTSDFYEITEDEAMNIVDRIRREAGHGGSDY
jgi:hypothetical protein